MSFSTVDEVERGRLWTPAVLGLLAFGGEEGQGRAGARVVVLGGGGMRANKQKPAETIKCEALMCK